jgi:vacuolar-type H+-ATPase subunit I/STV1
LWDFPLFFMTLKFEESLAPAPYMGGEYRMLAVIFIGTIFMLLGIFTRFAQSTDDGQTVERTTDRRSIAVFVVVVVVAWINPSQKHTQTTSGV